MHSILRRNGSRIGPGDDVFCGYARADSGSKAGSGSNTGTDSGADSGADSNTGAEKPFTNKREGDPGRNPEPSCYSVGGKLGWSKASDRTDAGGHYI